MAILKIFCVQKTPDSKARHDVDETNLAHAVKLLNEGKDAETVTQSLMSHGMCSWCATDRYIYHACEQVK